jgi:SAM-dependent methyltransferase
MHIRRSTSGRQPGPAFGYNGIEGNWWLERAADAPHQRAYRNIAAFVRNSFSQSPPLIVDYACGTGNLLALLGRCFPDSRLVGLDGSALLLDRAEELLSRLPGDVARRIGLIETALPAETAPCRPAELVTYCFPNMMPSRDEEESCDTSLGLSDGERRIAEILLEKGATTGGRHLRVQESWNPLAYNRSISRDLRGLLVRGGTCVRAEYATTRRHEWSALELQQVSFEEGSLESAPGGARLKPWFRVLASAYFRSKVLEDVFQQTGDEQDRDGGYLITVLRAL